MTNEEIAKMSVDTLRQFIIDTEDIDFDESDAAKLKKPQLVKIVQDYTQQLSDTENGFDLQYEKPEIVPNTLQEVLPRYGTDEWQQYVLSLLKPEEFFEGSPKMAGLRRVAQMLLGDIVFSGADSVSVIAQEDGRAVTVNYKVTFAWKLDFGISMVDLSRAEFEYRTFMGIADCVENRDSIYAVHPAAFAETKAMARAFKTALCLSVVTADEKVSGYGNRNTSSQPTKKDDTGKPASPQLFKIIEQWSKASNIPHIETLKENLDEITGGVAKEFEELTETEAKTLYKVMTRKQEG